MIGAARGLAESLVQVLLSLIVAIIFWTMATGWFPCCTMR
jgi:hypothetical protein